MPLLFLTVLFRQAAIGIFDKPQKVLSLRGAADLDKHDKVGMPLSCSFAAVLRGQSAWPDSSTCCYWYLGMQKGGVLHFCYLPRALHWGAGHGHHAPVVDVRQTIVHCPAAAQWRSLCWWLGQGYPAGGLQISVPLVAERCRPWWWLR